MKKQKNILRTALGTLTLLAFVFPAFGTPCAWGQIVDNPIRASRTFSFAWTDVDKYPVITTFAFLPDGERLVTGGDDCKIAVWHLSDGELLNHFRAHDDWVRGIEVSPSGLIASVDQSGQLRVWNAADMSEKITFAEELKGSQALALSPDGTHLAVSGFESYVATFDIESGKALGKWKMPGTSNTALKYSPDGQFLAAAGRSGQVRIWDANSMKVRKNIDASHRRIHAIAFSDDGALMAAGGDDTEISVWDTKTWKCIRRFKTSNGKTYSLCFCGTLLASGDSLNAIHLWDLQSGAEVGQCQGHTGTVAVMQYRPETGELTSAGFDTTVRFWPLDTSDANNNAL